MLNKIFFCLFCPQKFTKVKTNDQNLQNLLRNHILERHFGNIRDDDNVNKWIQSFIDYQNDLNICLSSEPKSVPKTSICLTNGSKSKAKVLKGCPLCDKIIDCFKLNINYDNKRKDLCVCGGGTEVTEIVVNCIQCKHLYHFPCVEPTGYSGEEKSLYKCFKCKQKDFEISDLSSEPERFQPIHVRDHLKYQPFVCNAFKIINNKKVVCNELYSQLNLLKGHLKIEHKPNFNESEVSNYYEINEIPIIKNLIDNSLKKLSTNTENLIVGQNCVKRSSLIENSDQLNSDNLMKTKRSRIETNSQVLPPPPIIEPFNKYHRNTISSAPPHLTPAAEEPPLLVNQSLYHNRDAINPQMPPKRGRGRPKGTKSKSNTGLNRNLSTINGKKQSPLNCYVADGNPQLKSRLSEKSRLSRPNISLSREQEKELQNKRLKTNGNKTATHSKAKRGDDNSEWDSDIEKYEVNRLSEQINISSHSSKKSDPRVLNYTNHNKKNENTLRIQQSYRPVVSTSATTTAFRSQRKETNTVPEQIRENVESINMPSTSYGDQRMRSSTDKTSNNSQQLFGNNFDKNGLNTNERANGFGSLQTEMTGNESENGPTPNYMISNCTVTSGNKSTVTQNSALSDWLTHTKPKKFPYFPQINDVVVYIPYGHKLYMDTVRQYGLYIQTNPNRYLNKYLDDTLIAKVKEIKFDKVNNVRRAQLKLVPDDPKENTTSSFIVKFHDINDVLDFIILKQNYDNSLAFNWKIHDYFRTIIDEKWWFGQITSFVVSENNMKTQFQSMSIIWGNGTTDVLSLWDLEPIIGSVPQNKNLSIDVTDAERSNFYIPDVKEWPVCGKQEECNRIVKGLNEIIELEEYKSLKQVMDVSKSEYVNNVSYLINLELIKSRLQNMFYRRHSAIKYDIKFLVSNASILDPTKAKGIVLNAQIVVSVCLKFIDEQKNTNIKDIYQKVKSDPQNLTKIKYYACTRPNLNPNPNMGNLLLKKTCAQILGGNNLPLNILTPSNTTVNTIRYSNDSQFSVIELSDDEEVSDENRSENVSEQSLESMNQIDVNENMTRSESPDMPQLEVFNDNQCIHSRSTNLKPVGTVRGIPQPKGRRSLQESPDLFRRYFCIFCSNKFADRTEAMDHYFRELKVELKCGLCPLNTTFESFEMYSQHNSDHKLSVNSKDYSNAKQWIQKIIQYMDALLTPLDIQEQINQEFGDYCPVCKKMNVLTSDSQPLFHKSVFRNKRISMKTSNNGELNFMKHMNKHLMYEPNYKCVLCSLNKTEFLSKQVDDKCLQHLQTVHKYNFQTSEQTSAFFSNNKIPAIDDMIPTAVNLFFINCANW